MIKKATRRIKINRKRGWSKRKPNESKKGKKLNREVIFPLS